MRTPSGVVRASQTDIEGHQLVSQYKAMISLPNIRMESDEKVKEHAKIALGAISDCTGFSPPEVVAH
jgi:hypothetical protein